MVQVLFSPEAQRQVERLPKTIRLRLIRVIRELERWPEVSGVKPLTGDRAGSFRKRTGDYRVVFRVAGPKLVIESIGHRKDIY